MKQAIIVRSSVRFRPTMLGSSSYHYHQTIYPVQCCIPITIIKLSTQCSVVFLSLSANNLPSATLSSHYYHQIIYPVQCFLPITITKLSTHSNIGFLSLSPNYLPIAILDSYHYHQTIYQVQCFIPISIAKISTQCNVVKQTKVIKQKMDCLGFVKDFDSQKEVALPITKNMFINYNVETQTNLSYRVTVIFWLTITGSSSHLDKLNAWQVQCFGTG